MIIPIIAGAEIQVENIDVEEKTFKSLYLKEDQIEEFLRKNIDLILGDVDPRCQARISKR